MKKNNTRWWIAGTLAVIAVAAVYGVSESRFAAQSSTSEASRAQGLSSSSAGKVTMIDLGATECIPCKMMAPIIEELKKEYTGKADIIFIDVWKNPDQARKYNIRAIPTQIFFDAEGREVHRNTGFMDKNRIVAILTRLGVS